MLEEANVPYVHKSEFSDLAKKCSVFGAESTTIAPPVVVDGDYTVSQSVVLIMYVRGIRARKKIQNPLCIKVVLFDDYTISFAPCTHTMHM